MRSQAGEALKVGLDGGCFRMVDCHIVKWATGTELAEASLACDGVARGNPSRDALSGGSGSNEKDHGRWPHDGLYSNT